MLKWNSKWKSRLKSKRSLPLKWTVTGVALLSMMGLAGCSEAPVPSLRSSSSASGTSAGVAVGNSVGNFAEAATAGHSAGNGVGTAVQSASRASTRASSSFAGSVTPSNLVPVVVAKEVDGDTIHVTMPNGSDETIRMLLIDTPEDVKPNTPVEPFSLAAAAFARQELPVGSHIYLEEGKPGYTRDKYGRLLAFVYVTKTDMYNEDVVRRGLARVGYIYPPNTQHLPALDADQSYAKSHHLGIWSIPGYVTSNGYNMSAVPKGYSSWTASAGLSGGTTSGTTTSGSSTGSGDGSNGSGSNGSSSTGATSSSGSTAISIVSSTLSVQDGGYASVTIHTSPSASASIEVDYKSGPSHASGLGTKTADASGNITWEWKVGSNTTKGSWPVVIRVGSKTLQLTLNVK